VSYVHSTEIRDGLRVQVIADESYDWDFLKEAEPLGVFVVSARNFGCGDRDLEGDERDALERGGWKLLVRYLRMSKDAVCVLPVSGLDHSGQTIWVASSPGETSASDSAGWDSGGIGFIYTTRERVKELGIPDTTREIKMRLGFGSYTDTVSEVEAQLRGQIEELDQLMTGDVWGIVVSEPTDEAMVEADNDVTLIDEDDDDAWEHVDSCWGFIGIEYAEKDGVSEMLDNAKATIEWRTKAAVKVEEAWATA